MRPCSPPVGGCWRAWPACQPSISSARAPHCRLPQRRLAHLRLPHNERRIPVCGPGSKAIRSTLLHSSRTGGCGALSRLRPLLLPGMCDRASGSMTCAHCVARQSAALTRQRPGSARWIALSLAGLLFAWVVFYYLEWFWHACLRSLRGPQLMQARSAVQILEESVTLLREAPPEAIAAYLAGAIPFSLPCCSFYGNDTQPLVPKLALESAVTRGHACWFGNTSGRPFSWPVRHGTLSPRPVGVASLARLAAMQCAIQPLRIVVVPLSLLLTVPTPR